MQTVITRAGMTFPVTIKTRQRVGATGFEGVPNTLLAVSLGSFISKNYVASLARALQPHRG